MANMRVSFDLDEVLFVNPKTHKTEPELPFPFRLIFKERLRYGTPRLIPKLQELGFDVWIYTSSFRTIRYIRGLFRMYGIHFDGIVNAQRHEREVQAGHKHILPQKMPNFYRITLHIDDESVVMTSGKNYGFNVHLLNAQDDDWEQKIIDHILDLQRKNELQGRSYRSIDSCQ